MIKKIVYILIIFVFTENVFGQTTDEQLASHYYRNGEYAKALVYYKKLYDNNPTTAYYGYYLTCLEESGDLKNAEKLIKKQIKKEPYNSIYYVDLGILYNKNNDESKGTSQFKKAISDMQPERGLIVQLANYFITKELPDYALKTYQQGQKMMNGYANFNFEIANLYGSLGQYNLMINSYLDLLEENTGYIQSVQNSLNRTIGFDKESEKLTILKTELLKRIQKHPDLTIYFEMLIWTYIQVKNFDAAMVQVKALDKRENGKGKRIIALSRLCASNELYDLASQGYEYVISLGTEKFYYSTAKAEYLSALNNKLTKKNNYTQADLIQLESLYKSTLDELGKSASTIEIIKQLAHLQAFYQNKTEEPMFALKEAIDMPGITKYTKAECKLELGDILLMNGSIWNASLYYAQVDKDFKHDAIGSLAKFKYAKIFYYTGEFLWAQSQLDVLKASTEKLIANDAMHLSLLITDNLALDTTTTAMRLFADADLLTVQNKFEDALQKLDSINLIFPWHSLNDEILYAKYKIHYQKMKYEQAAEDLGEIVKNYSDDILADDALFHLAKLYDNELQNKEVAKDLYSQLLLNYPGSLFVAEARERFRLLRGDVNGGGLNILDEPNAQ